MPAIPRASFFGKISGPVELHWKLLGTPFVDLALKLRASKGDSNVNAVQTAARSKARNDNILNGSQLNTNPTLVSLGAIALRF